MSYPSMITGSDAMGGDESKFHYSTFFPSNWVCETDSDDGDDRFQSIVLQSPLQARGESVSIRLQEESQIETVGDTAMNVDEERSKKANARLDPFGSQAPFVKIRKVEKSALNTQSDGGSSDLANPLAKAYEELQAARKSLYENQGIIIAQEIKIEVLKSEIFKLKEDNAEVSILRREKLKLIYTLKEHNARIQDLERENADKAEDIDICRRILSKGKRSRKSSVGRALSAQASTTSKRTKRGKEERVTDTNGSQESETSSYASTATPHCRTCYLE